MAVFKNFNEDELIIDCDCGCDQRIHFKIADFDNDNYMLMTFTNGNYYKEQGSFLGKLKKIWKVNSDVMVAVEEKYDKADITTVTKGSFGSIELGNMIKEYCGAEQAEVHFVGVCTGICVISNVMILKAFMPEAKVCVIERACACVTKESHNTAIAAMRTAQVDII